MLQMRGRETKKSCYAADWGESKSLNGALEGERGSEGGDMAESEGEATGSDEDDEAEANLEGEWTIPGLEVGDEVTFTTTLRLSKVNSAGAAPRSLNLISSPGTPSTSKLISGSKIGKVKARSVSSSTTMTRAAIFSEARDIFLDDLHFGQLARCSWPSIWANKKKKRYWKNNIANYNNFSRHQQVCVRTTFRHGLPQPSSGLLLKQVCVRTTFRHGLPQPSSGLQTWRWQPMLKRRSDTNLLVPWEVVVIMSSQQDLSLKHCKCFRSEKKNAEPFPKIKQNQSWCFQSKPDRFVNKFRVDFLKAGVIRNVSSQTCA